MSKSNKPSEVDTKGSVQTFGIFEHFAINSKAILVEAKAMWEPVRADRCGYSECLGARQGDFDGLPNARVEVWDIAREFRKDTRDDPFRDGFNRKGHFLSIWNDFFENARNVTSLQLGPVYKHFVNCASSLISFS